MLHWFNKYHGSSQAQKSIDNNNEQQLLVIHPAPAKYHHSSARSIQFSLRNSDRWRNGTKNVHWRTHFINGWRGSLRSHAFLVSAGTVLYARWLWISFPFFYQPRVKSDVSHRAELAGLALYLPVLHRCLMIAICNSFGCLRKRLTLQFANLTKMGSIIVLCRTFADRTVFNDSSSVAINVFFIIKSRFVEYIKKAK